MLLPCRHRLATEQADEANCPRPDGTDGFELHPFLHRQRIVDCAVIQLRAPAATARMTLRADDPLHRPLVRSGATRVDGDSHHRHTASTRFLNLWYPLRPCAPYASDWLSHRCGRTRYPMGRRSLRRTHFSCLFA